MPITHSGHRVRAVRAWFSIYFIREAAEERRSSARPSLPSTATTTTTILLLLRIFTAVTVCVLCCGAPL